MKREIKQRHEPKPAPLGVPRPDPSEHGVGVIRAQGEYRLIAVRPIARDQILFRIEGLVTSVPSRYSVQISEDLHIDLGPGHTHEQIMDRYYWRFMNHHCDPCTTIQGRDVVAVRPIFPWEDVTFNYNTTEYDMAEPFQCRCNSGHCQREIRGFKHLSESERQRLVPLVAPHLGPPPASDQILAEKRRLALRA